MSNLLSSKNWVRFGQLALLLVLLGGAYYLFSPAGLAGQNRSLQRELLHTQREQANLRQQLKQLHRKLAQQQYDKRTDNVVLLERELARQKDQYMQQIELYKQVVNLPISCDFTPPTPDCAALRRQVKLLRDQVAFAEANCTRQMAVAQKPRSAARKRLLQESRKAFINIIQLTENEDMKHSVEQVVQAMNVELDRPVYSYEQLPN